MAMIVAASSIYHSLKSLELEERRETQQKVYAVPGLSLNPNTLNRGKNVRVLLEQQPLASKQIIFWHDLLNNSISSHRTNNYTPCPLDDLLAYLQLKRRQLSAIVYCRRTGTPNFFENLRRTEIIVIKKTSNLISRSKRQNPAVLREYLQLHQSWGIGTEVATGCAVPSRPPARHFLKDTDPDQETITGTPQCKGAESGGVGWGPSSGTKRPKSGKILLRQFFICRVPHEFKCSCPAKKK